METAHLNFGLIVSDSLDCFFDVMLHKKGNYHFIFNYSAKQFIFTDVWIQRKNNSILNFPIKQFA